MLVKTMDELTHLAWLIHRDKPKWIAVDFETYGPVQEWKKRSKGGKSDPMVDPLRHKIAGFSVSWCGAELVQNRAIYDLGYGDSEAPGAFCHKKARLIAPRLPTPKSAYVAVFHQKEWISYDAAARFLSDLGDMGRVWAHNWYFDAWAYRSLQIDLPEKKADTKTLAWLLDFGIPFFDKEGREGRRLGLKGLIKYLFGEAMTSYTETVGDGRVWVGGPTDLEVEEQLHQAMLDMKPQTGFGFVEYLQLTRKQKASIEAQRKTLLAQQKWRAKQMCDLAPEEAAGYGADDAAQTLRLAALMWPVLHQQGLFETHEEVEVPIGDVLVDMLDAGIGIDEEHVQDLRRSLEIEVRELESQWEQAIYIATDKPPPSIRSAKQLTEFLYEQEVWPKEGAPQTKKGQYQVNKEAVKRAKQVLPEDSLGWQLADIKEKHSKAYKLLNTYTTQLLSQLPYRADRRLRCEFSQTGTMTGRFSCSGPNLTAQPRDKRIRKAYTA